MFHTMNCAWRTTCHARRHGVAMLLLALAALAVLWPQAGFAQDTTPQIHIPNFGSDSPNPARGAVLWFGEVTPATNSANVRLAYNNEGLAITLHILDRRVIYNENAAATSDLTQWDAVSLYLETQSTPSAAPGTNSFRFDSQLNHWQARTSFQRAYRWQNGAWQAADLSFTTETGFRGYPNDQEDDRGWLDGFFIPFASMGLTAPAQGAEWRMALVLHDRDEVAGAPLPAESWPERANLQQPATWARIGFGAPVYTAPNVNESKTLTLRHGVNGITAPDGEVGGHSECGGQFHPNYFNGWGDANYTGYVQINIQNQWDVADWPCFSRYYVDFPLTSLPATARVVSATLTMYMFGNAGYTAEDPKPSFIQVARVAGAWEENTLAWNNAPLVLENTSWTVVDPLRDGDPVPKPVIWDVTEAVADALDANETLRLSLYSSDGDYHSGKYFWSANAGEGVRPLLKITWGSEGYTVTAVPIKPTITTGETAQYELNIAGLSAGETVTLKAGPSLPSGLEVVMKPASVAAPGGKVVVTLRDASGANTGQGIVYSVPVTATDSQGNKRTVELAVLVNGQFLFLPSVQNQ